MQKKIFWIWIPTMFILHPHYCQTYPETKFTVKCFSFWDFCFRGLFNFKTQCVLPLKDKFLLLNLATSEMILLWRAFHVSFWVAAYVFWNFIPRISINEKSRKVRSLSEYWFFMVYNMISVLDHYTVYRTHSWKSIIFIQSLSPSLTKGVTFFSS